jgi:hypothetical protein
VANFLKSMAKRDLLVPHLDGWFSRAEFPPTIDFSIRLHKEPDDAYHPSSDAALCAQALYAKKAGDADARPFTGSSYKSFMAGHYWHEVIQYILLELGFSKPEDIEKERRAFSWGNGLLVDNGNVPPGDPPRWWARGYIDVAHCNIPGQGDYLVDIKTMGGHSYKAQRMDADLWAKYYAQMQCYLDWENQEKCILLCVEKDSPHRFREILIDRDPAFVEKIYQRWDVVTEALKAGVPPRCDQEHDCPADKYYEGVYID